MDRQTLIAAMGNPVISEDEVAAFNDALIRADCTTVDRAAMFLAQTGHECDGLRTYEEYASGSQYEGRSDLGNTQPGDGKRFKGRSIIQVTGRYNYGRCSEWAFDKGYVPTRTFFVDHPEALGTVEYCTLGAVWYWTVSRPMNSYADRGDIEAATRAVNGGLNGYADRINRWKTCLALGEALLPTEGFLMSAADSANAAQLGPASTWGKTPRQLAAGYDPDKVGEWGREAIEAAAVPLATREQSRSRYRGDNTANFKIDELIRNLDGRIHELSVELGAVHGDPESLAVLKAAATAGDARAAAFVTSIEGK
jgi:putative chitinase